MDITLHQKKLVPCCLCPKSRDQICIILLVFIIFLHGICRLCIQIGSHTGLQTVKRIRDRIQPDIVRVDFIQLHGDLVDIQIHEHIHKQHDKDRQNEYTDQLCPD